MSVTTFPFGTTADGREVTAWRIDNGVIAATVIDYGATLQSLVVTASDGTSVDVVLGYDTIFEYEQNTGFAGAVIGRVGNRIGGAAFTLGGREYRLEANDGPNHLHGGVKGFDRRMWQGEANGGDTVSFFRLSPDGEEGYPGNLRVRVSYTLAENSLVISYDADADADTPVNLTNHSYFNLNGGGTVLEHELQVSAELFTENDEDCLPTGRILSVEDTALDFRCAKPIGRDIDACDEQLRRGGYDHNFILTGSRNAAILRGDKSGIRMTMHTDMPGVQIYSANNLEPRCGKGGAAWTYRDAVCLETQLFPNALNCYAFPSPILRAGRHMHSVTSFEFE